MSKKIFDQKWFEAEEEQLISRSLYVVPIMIYLREWEIRILVMGLELGIAEEKTDIDLVTCVEFLDNTAFQSTV